MSHIINHGIKINYESIGHGEPLIMLHPNGHCIKDWYILNYLSKLEKYFQCVLIDSRGFGDSDKPHDANQYTSELIASDTIAVMNQLGIAKAHCFGYSMGGRNAFGLMYYYPEYFNSFIIGGAHPYAVNKLLNSYTNLLKKGLPEVINAFESNFGNFPIEVKNNFLKNDLIALLTINNLPLIDFSDALKKYIGNVSFIVGDKDPILQHVKKAHEIIPLSQLHIISNKNHMQLYFDSKLMETLLYDSVFRK